MGLTKSEKPTISKKENIKFTEKYTSIVFYIINTHLPSKTKLNKILFLADVKMYNKNLKLITGDDYIRRQYGPVPESIEHIIKGMKSKKIIEEYKEPPSPGLDYHKIKYKTHPDYKHNNKFKFNKEEQDILDDVISFCSPLSSKILSEKTHTYVWEAYEEWAIIPKETFLIYFEKYQDITKEEREKALQLAIKELGLENVESA